MSPGLDYRGWIGKILIAKWNFPYSLKYPIKAMTDNIVSMASMFRYQMRNSETPAKCPAI